VYRSRLETRISVEWRILGRLHLAHALVSEMYAYDFTVLAGRLLVQLSIKRIYLATSRCNPSSAIASYLVVIRSSAPAQLVYSNPTVDTPMRTPMTRWHRFRRFLAERVLAPTTPLQSRAAQVLTRFVRWRTESRRHRQRLAMSGRTLQRRLAENNCRFREIVEDVRRRASCISSARIPPSSTSAICSGFAIRDHSSSIQALDRHDPAGVARRTCQAEVT
jgi:hypothetical protein